MLFYLTVLLVIVAGAIYPTYVLILHPLFISPLRHIPTAFPGASITSLWIKYHRRGGSQALQVTARAHDLQGPVVRMGPNDVSIASFEGARKVYIEKGGFAKPRWWAESFMSYGVKNLVSMQGGIGNKDHAARKRDVGNVYTRSFLMANEELKEMAKTVVGNVTVVLNNVIKEKGGVFEVYNFNGATSVDLVSAYIYGLPNSTNFLRDPKFCDTYYQYQATWLKGRSGAADAQKWLENFGSEKRRDAEKDVEKAGIDAIVYKQLSARGLEGNVLASELLDHFIAGAEATRTTLTYLQRELSKQPAMMRRLRKELEELDPPLILTEDKTAVCMPPFKQLLDLKFLDALLMETMRRYTPTPGPQYRITPAEGATIHGYFIPGGVQVSTCLSILHRHAPVFPDGEVWNPDRWLLGDAAQLEEMRRWFWAFLHGSRVCIGKELAMLVMKLVVAAIYSQYETEIVNDDNMEQDDSFLAGPVGEKLVLRFERVRLDHV